MRIVHVITRLIVGGAQENTLLSCRGLAERGHDVCLLTGPQTGPEGEMFGAARAYGLNMEVLQHLRREVSPVHDPLALVELVSVFRRLRPQVVHTHSSKAGILGRLAAKLAGVRIVVHTIHGLPFFPYQSRLTNGVYLFAERLAGRWAEKLVAVADDMVRQARRTKLADKDKFITIRSGLEPEKFRRDSIGDQEVRQRLGIPNNAFVVGMVARLAPLKGHKYLLDALEGLMDSQPGLRCLLVGDGILRGEIKRKIQGSSLAGKVHLTGLVQPKRVPEMLWAMDMLVHTSLHEGLPRAVVQGLLAGLPVAAFDLDGAREVIADGLNGYLIRPESVSELRQAIQAVIEGSSTVKPPSALQIEELAQKFSWRVMVEKLETLYESLVEQKRHNRGRVI